MARGNGKQAQTAPKAGNGLLAYVKGGTNGQSNEVREYIDWREVDPRLVTGAVTAAVYLEGAIMFGASRDKTCYSVRLYAGNEGKTYYFPANAAGIMDLEGFLQGIIALADE